MAYKFQRGAATYSGSLTIGDTLTLEGLFSSSAKMSASYYFGDGSNLSGISAGVGTTTDNTDSTRYIPFVANATTTNPETILIDSALAINPSTGVFTLAGSAPALVIGSANLIESDLEKLDGITNGTAAASKAVVLSAAKAITGLGDVSGSGISGSTQLQIGGAADFASAVRLQSGSALSFNGSTNTMKISANSGTDMNIFSPGDIVLDPGGNNVNPGSNNADDLGTSGTAWKTVWTLGLDVGDGNIANVGDIDCDTISVADAANGLQIQFGGVTTTNKITLTDNLAEALTIEESGSDYIKFITTDASEGVEFGQDVSIVDGKKLKFAGDGAISFKSATTGQSGLFMTDNLASAFTINQAATSYLKFTTTNSDEAVVVGDINLQVGSTPGNGGGVINYGSEMFLGQLLVTADKTLSDINYSHYLVSGSGKTVLTLPEAETGLSVVVKRDPLMSGGNVEIASDSSELIENSTDNVVLESAGASLQLVASGSAWFIY